MSTPTRPHRRRRGPALTAALVAAAASPAALAAAFDGSTAAISLAAAAEQTRLFQDAADQWGVREAMLAPVRPELAEDGRTITVDVPLDGVMRTLRVVPHSIRAEGFQLIAQTDDGLVDVEPEPARTVRGVMVGAPGSAVAGSVLDDGFHAAVRLADGTRWWIEAVGDRLPDVDADAHIIYRNEDILPVARFCGIATRPGTTFGERPDPVPPAEAASDAEGGSEGLVLCVAELANDADFEYFQDYGSVQAVQDRVELVVNATNVQYETEVGITHVITATIVRTTSNDPYVNFDSFGLLCDFITEWTNNQGDIQRDVAHLWTGRDITGGVIGRAADIGNTGICVSQGGCEGGTFGTFGSYCFSQSDFNNNFGCATDLTAHELGHLWGAFHCSCPSHTMNPSITCANTFEPNVTRPSIEAYRDTRTCIECETAVSFTFPDGLPELVDPSGGTTVRVEVGAGLGVPMPGLTLLVIEDGVPTPYPAIEIEPNVYDVVFPPATCPEPVSYFLAVEVSGFGLVTFPADGSEQPLQTVAANAIDVVFEDDFETDTGWLVQDDPGLDDGSWTRGVPVGGGDRGDPPNDGDGSGACYLTDNVDGNSDVDGGATRLISPVFDATGDDTVLEYLRWYDNTAGDSPNQDVFTVEYSVNGGASWLPLETVGPGGPEAAGGWFARSWVLRDLGVPPTDQFRVRFTAEDAGPGSIVEAAVDGVRVFSADCAPACPEDLDGNGAVGFDDLLAVLSSFGPCDACPEDLDGNGEVGFDDLLSLLSAFGPCPG